MDNREANRAGHPPACTCFECNRKRLQRLREEGKDKLSRFLFPKSSLRPKKASRSGGRVRCGMASKFAKGVIKLCLNLIVLAGLVLLARYGYQLFTTSQESPLEGSVLLILGFIAWVIVIKLLGSKSMHYWLRYKWTSPSLRLTVLSIVAISLVLTFAGVQPIATYKDSAKDSFVARYASWQESMKEAREAQEIVEKERQRNELFEVVVAMPPVVTEAVPKTFAVSETLNVRRAEEIAFALINMYREENGVPATLWDDELYKLSKAHTQKMADKGEIFHSSSGVFGENAWGGTGYASYNTDDLAIAIVASWSGSPLHNAWLLYTPIKESCVSIVILPNGHYASWSFWISRLRGGPDLVIKVSKEYRNSGSNLDWISWLKSKGYL